MKKILGHFIHPPGQAGQDDFQPRILISGTHKPWCSFWFCLLLFSVFTCFWFCLLPQCLTWFLFCRVPSSLICYYQQTFQSNFPLKLVRQISHLPSPSRLSRHPKCQDHQCAQYVWWKGDHPKGTAPQAGILKDSCLDGAVACPPSLLAAGTTSLLMIDLVGWLLPWHETHGARPALTIHRLGLGGGRLLLLCPHAALFDAPDFRPELLHRRAAVDRGLGVGATEGRRMQGLIGEHPVNSSAARNGFSGERKTAASNHAPVQSHRGNRI